MKLIRACLSSVALSCALLSTPTRAQVPPVQSVPSVDVQRYAGQWFEQTRLPNFFQSGCLGDVVVNYRVQTDGSIEVVNRCREANDKTNQVQGRAVAATGDTSGARLKVSFLPSWLQWVPFTQGDYWVVMLDAENRYAVVSEPSRKYLWVLSRAPVMDASTYDAVMAELKLKGYPVEGLVRTPQRP
jgi:apolipoprotein D and lipocalin family protein